MGITLMTMQFELYCLPSELHITLLLAIWEPINNYCDFAFNVCVKLLKDLRYLKQ